MARKKAKTALDEESVKEIYTNKNYIPPKDIELETINEDSKEEKEIESQLSPVAALTPSQSSENKDLNLKQQDNNFSATGFGSRVGKRISSRRNSSLNRSQLPAKQPEFSGTSEVRKIDNVPFWLGNKTKDRKRRSMVAKLMKGRKKYKWKGLSEEEEIQMESMLLNCENSPIKTLSPCKFSPRKSILAEITDDNNVTDDVNKSDKQENSCYELSKNMESPHENAHCDMLDVFGPTNSSANTDICLSLSNAENASIDSSIDNIRYLDVGQPLEKSKATKQKSKRRSNSFVPYSKCLKEQSQAEASIDNVIHETCRLYSEQKTIACEIESKFEEKTKSLSSNTKTAVENFQNAYEVADCSSHIQVHKNGTVLSPKNCEPSSLHQSGSFIDDSFILKQVNEADQLLGGFLDDTICNKSRSISPIFDDITLKKTSRNSRKVHSVRRSSRLFRSKQIASLVDNSDKENVRGSVYTEVELVHKNRTKK